MIPARLQPVVVLPPVERPARPCRPQQPQSAAARHQRPAMQAKAAARVGGRKGPRGPRCGADDVLAAVRSLYRDELRPFGRILRMRLEERVAERAAGVHASVDAQWLLSACSSEPSLLVVDEQGGDWSALLRGEPEAFVDVYSPIDPFPAELWGSACEYFASLEGADGHLPCGRYSCARVLVARQLPFLAGLSLGQVCHVVQLAISQKKVLGHSNGMLVPHECSKAMQKQVAAEGQQPCKGTPDGALATWRQLRSWLESALGSKGCSSISLASVKRLFAERFDAELSETALGHCKLSGLLQDPRVSDLCSVRLEKNGYTVCRKAAASPSVPLRAAETAAPLPTLLGSSAVARGGCDGKPGVWSRPLVPAATLAQLRRGALVKKTFIDVPAEAPAPLARGRRALSAHR